jgi:hypothetical protein
MACCGQGTARRDAQMAAAGFPAGRPAGRLGAHCYLCRIWDILTHESKTPYGDPCVNFPGHVIRKPDPCIYSQFLLMQLNQPVTWDNPDVRIFLGGVEQNTYNLTADTEYRVEISVHNSSRDKPALGTTVHVRWIEFGAGGQIRHPITTLTADVPLWPGTAVVNTLWRTPATPGHYCIEVELAHPDDANPANNRGWNNTQVHAANSPVTRPIRIFNRYPNGCPDVKEGGGPYLRIQRVLWGWGVLGALAGLFLRHHTLDRVEPGAQWLVRMGIGYVLLVLLGTISEWLYAYIKRRRRVDPGTREKERIPCQLVETTVDSYEFHDHVGKDFDAGTAFNGKPPVWPAFVQPAQFLFANGELYRDVELHVDAPDPPGAAGVFNVNVRQGGVPAGGVTITITRG